MAKNDIGEDALIARKSALQEMGNPDFLEHHLTPYGRYLYGHPREDLGLREFWRGLQRHKLAILTVVIMITAVATIVTLRARSTYLASTILVMGNDGPAIIRTGETLVQNEDSEAGTVTGIKTKMVMMKSQELLEDVVVGLQLDQNPKFLEGLNQGALNRLLSLGQSQTSPPTEQPVPIGTLGKDTVRSTQERKRLDPFVRVVENNLNVEQIRETRALKVSFVHTDPEIAASVADGVAQNFIQRNFQSKTERFTNAASWLNQSTLELKRRVEKAEQSLADYTRANNIFSTAGTSTLTTEKLAKLHDQVTRAEAERILKETLYEAVKLGRVSEVPEVFAEMTSKSPPRILELNKQLGELSANEAQLSVHFGPSNPQLQEVRQQIAAVKDQIEASRKLLNEKLRTEYEQAVREEQSLKEVLAKAKMDAVDENQAAIQYNILKQEVETAKALYTEFLQKSNQSKMQVAEQYSSIRIIDHAKVPTAAYGPRRALNILLWFTVSLLLGVGLAMLLEFLDNTIKNADDVAQFLHLSTLAAIPCFKAVTYQLPSKSGGQQETASGDYQQTAIIKGKGIAPLSDADGGLIAAEAYHALRTAVLLSTAEGPPKTILVTSSEAGDGKTTTAVNLAFSLCELGSRVLVIDADMRHPKAHQVFGLDRNRGLSTYLSRDVGVGKLIQHLNKPKISLLASGPIPPNPASLISSPKMRSLLELLSDEYDYIVIDSPPFGIVSDTAILSTMVDGVVLIAQGGKSRRDMVRRVKNDLMSVGARIIGIVINKVDRKGDGYNDYSVTRYYFKQAEQERRLLNQHI